MHNRMRDLFNERRAPKHCCRTRANAAMRPVGAFAANLMRQMAEYRAMLMEAKTADDLDPRYRPKLDYLEQPVAAGERIAHELMRLQSEATSLMLQLEKVFDESEADVEETERRIARPATPDQ